MSSSTAAFSSLSLNLSFIILLVMVIFFPEDTDVLPFQTQKEKFTFCFLVTLFDQKIVLTISFFASRPREECPRVT